MPESKSRRKKKHLVDLDFLKREIFIKYGDEVVKVRVDNDEPISEIKKKFQEQTGVEIADQKMFYSGLKREFMDDKSLRYYGCLGGGFFTMEKHVEVSEDEDCDGDSDRLHMSLGDLGGHRRTSQERRNSDRSSRELEGDIKLIIAETEAEERRKKQLEEREAIFRLKARSDALRKAEEEAKRKAAEEEAARLKAEEAARFKAEEAARLKAEEAARFKAEEEARLKAEEEARLKAEEEAAPLKAEEEARLKAEEAARLKVEEARLKAEEEEARLKAEEVARLKAEEAARVKAEEAARVKAEEEARLKAEEAGGSPNGQEKSKKKKKDKKQKGDDDYEIPPWPRKKYGINHTPTPFDMTRFRIWYMVGDGIPFEMDTPVACTVLGLKEYVLETRQASRLVEEYLKGVEHPKELVVYPAGTSPYTYMDSPEKLPEPLDDDLPVPRDSDDRTLFLVVKAR